MANRQPSYLSLSRQDLDARVRAALQELERCEVCPRNCHVNRMHDETRACRTGRHAIVSSAFPHFGEEDCIRGRRGSGTIFFSLCNLHCQFCQNWEVSQKAEGREMTASELADLMIGLQEQGCHNINFVTPEHVAPQVVEAIAEAIPRGLRVPIIYNTSAYDSLRSLRLMEGLVDIYLPDFNFWSEETAKRLCRAHDYPERARAAIHEMHRQVGPLSIDDSGLAYRGVLVRHSVMPGQTREAQAILQWLAELSEDTYVNIMGQYRPSYRVGAITKEGTAHFPEINRRPYDLEIDAVFSAAARAGLSRLAPRRP